MHVIMKYTTFDREIYAVGGNAEAARLSVLQRRRPARIVIAPGLLSAPPCYVAAARNCAMVARLVICSGFIRNSITAGRPLATARRNAGANAAVVSTTSP
jgi:ribose/xylose/arabinose/galactoside ABC-type transport system permease subunit